MKNTIVTSKSKQFATGVKLLFLSCLFIFTTSNAQTTFFNDSCNTATGWTLGVMPPNGSNQYIAWRISNVSPYVIDGPALSINSFNKVAGSNAWTNDYFKTISANVVARKQVDARNYQSLTLKFDWICKGENSGTTIFDYGQVGYSTDGGTTFTWLTVGGPGGTGKYYGSTTINRAQTITLPTALNNIQFVLGFRWINDAAGGLDPAFIVDNIKVSGQSIGTLLPPKTAFFIDKFKTDAGWVLESGAATQMPNEYTAWRVSSGDSLCNIDSGSLSINHWNKLLSQNWSCGYLDNAPLDIKAYKKIDAKKYQGMELLFDWNCSGEFSGTNIYDYGQVGYSTDGGATFTWINTGGTNGLGQYYGSSTIVRNQNIILPTTLNNKEFLLGFRWVNDYSIEHDPGFVVSNIRVSGTNVGSQLTAVFKDNFDSESSWKLKKAAVDPSGKTLAWSIDNRCSIDGNSLSLKLYDNTVKEWVCGFTTNAAADIVAYRSISANNATNLFVKMDWKVTSTSTTDYGQIGYSTDGGTTFTWLTNGGINNTGKYYNQPTLVKSAMVKLPSSLEGINFQLGFRWINDASANAGQAMVVDNLSVIGVPTNSAAAVSTVEQQKVSRVTQEVLQVANKKTAADVDALTETGKLMEKKYYDGINRLIQDIYVKASPSKNDIVEPKLYDENGVNGVKIAPYRAETNDGGFHTTMLSEQYTYYNTTKPNFTKTEYAYSQILTDKSPMNNIAERGTIGKDFQPDPTNASVTRTTVLKQYTAIDNNPATAVEAIKYISIVPGTTDLKVDYYSAANGFTELFVKESIDEDKKVTRQYINDKKQTILVRKYAVNGTTILAQTYYVYDDMDLLRFIIQPEGIAKIITIPQTLANTIKDYCFEYTYDERGRIISKKVPGGGRVEMAYDRWDRPAITQDANQRAKTPQEFTFTKYDLLNRPIMSGTFTPTNRSLTIDLVRAELANPALGARYESRSLGTLPNSDYTNTATYPIPNSTNALDILAQTYYDDNNYTDIAGFTFTPYLGYTAASVVKNIKGLVSATKTKVLGTTSTWILSVNFYDQYDRVIQVQKQNINGIKSFITSTYDFLGRPLSTVEDNKLTAAAGVLLQSTSVYDHMGRITRASHQTNSQSAVILADFKYSDLGNKVKEKNVHSSTGATYLQSVDYTYNEKGWLTHINNGDLSNDAAVTNDDANDLFGLDLNYYTDLKIDATKAVYNGNIAEQIWNSKVTGDKKRGYVYTYDDLNRLTSASYKVYESNWTSSAENNRFSVTNIAYDGNGNINNLQQNGVLGTNSFGQIDNLTYNYTGNQLMKVGEGAVANTSYPYDFENGVNTDNDYSYDLNGNLMSDKNKGITGISYNVLNLIQQVTVGANKVIYSYDASGTKLRKQFYTGTTLMSTTDYWYSAQYTNSVVDFVMTTEGRAVNNGGTYKYEYFIKDQSGNVRITFGANTTSGLAEITQKDDYYPMGNTFNSLTPSKKNNYLFNGMEFQTEVNLNTFDFNARMYDPQLGRTFQVDPFADQFAALSPYSFLNNNPIRYIDPSGMFTFKMEEDFEDGGFGGGDMSFGGDFTISSNDPSITATDPPLPPMSAGVVETYGKRGSGISIYTQMGVYIAIGNFYTGFVNGKPPTDLNGPGTATATAGTLMDLTEAASKREARLAAKWSQKLAAEGSATIAKGVGKGVGVLDAVITLVESADDGVITAGEGAKVAISLITAFCPLGWAYGLADMTVAIATGKGITDRIGSGIDNVINAAK